MAYTPPLTPSDDGFQSNYADDGRRNAQLAKLPSAGRAQNPHDASLTPRQNTSGGCDPSLDLHFRLAQLNMNHSQAVLTSNTTQLPYASTEAEYSQSSSVSGTATNSSDFSGKTRYLPRFTAKSIDGNLQLPDTDDIIAPHREAGVLKIFGHDQDVRPNEVLVILGENAKVLTHSAKCGVQAIHIIQDRPTGKTADIFVEFQTKADAISALQEFEDRVARRKDIKFGAHRAHVQLSTQSELMGNMFPRAKCQWISGMPELSGQKDNSSFEDFGGFLTTEEMRMSNQLAQNPDAVKSHHAHMCPERVYQFLISTLIKIPWHAKPKNVWFSEKWLGDLVRMIDTMSVKLAHEIKSQRFRRLDVKLLTQFMSVLRHTPLFGSTTAGVERYDAIAARVDSIVHSFAFKTPLELAENARRIGAVDSPAKAKQNSSSFSRRRQPNAQSASIPHGHRRDTEKATNGDGGWRVAAPRGKLIPTQHGIANSPRSLLGSAGRFAALAVDGNDDGDD